MPKSKKQSVEEIIQIAVVATRIASERETKNAFKATEKRLYAYPILRLKIKNDLERIDEIRNYGVPKKSISVIGLMRSGSRLTPEEIAEALINDINSDIAVTENEIKNIDKALSIITEDQYADIIRYKYFENKSDDEISKIINCNPSTVRRQKSRLIGRLMIFLYGVMAIQ